MAVTETIEYVGDRNEWEKLATETCENFDLASQKAKEDFYKIKNCSMCKVQVIYDPNLKRLRVRYSCPKK